MGNETSAPHTPARSKYSSVELASPSKIAEMQELCDEVDERIQQFKMYAGTEAICSQLFRSWEQQCNNIKLSWSLLTTPARRAMVQNIREVVVMRGRTLPKIVFRNAKSRTAKRRLVHRLLEKLCGELFDTRILYDGCNLVDFVGSVLADGGNHSCPPFLVNEISDAFDIENGIDPSPRAGISTSRSHGNLRALKRQGSVGCVVDLLSFLPSEMELQSRKDLTVKLVTEIRNAFMVHFCVLVFGELIDDVDKVVHKYEYGSESDTDVATSETDWDLASSDGDRDEPEEDPDDLWLLSSNRTRDRAHT